MDIAAKLDHLLTHWVEHNDAHSQTYREWANQARLAGLASTAEHLEQAVQAVHLANDHLREALGTLPDDGPKPSHPHHHPHHDVKP